MRASQHLSAPLRGPADMKGDVRVWQLTSHAHREESNEIFILAITSGTVDLCCGDEQQNTKSHCLFMWELHL